MTPSLPMKFFYFVIDVVLSDSQVVNSHCVVLELREMIIE